MIRKGVEEVFRARFLTRFYVKEEQSDREHN